MLPADFLAALSVGRRLELWSRELVTSRFPGSLVFVLEVGERSVAGFANVGPCRDEDRHLPTQWELYAIYLLQEQWGTGNGARLLETALDAVPAGTTDVSLWVLALNDRARRFYERHGFAVDGAEHDHMIGEDSMRAARYVRALRD